MQILRIFFLVTFLFSGVQSMLSQSNDTLKYIFIGHPKLKRNGLDKVDPRVEALDLSVYDRVWLGGDITDESNLYYSNLEYIDSLFDVSNPSNHWAFGNHDLRNFNTDWLTEITGKRTFYTHHEKGITTIVLNFAIAPTNCELLNEQYNLIKSVCDTITNSSHLILMSHFCVWENVPGIRRSSLYAHFNLKKWISNCTDKPGDFAYTIYPMLTAVKNRGVEVINIIGDSGSFQKGISMVSSDSIHFIASGIQPNTQPVYGPDKLLIFKHIPNQRKLTWDFHVLDSL